MNPPFRNRTEAGRALATRLGAFAHRPDVIVLALPRGGVPVAYEVATTVEAPLDVWIVRKLGVPGHRELALGAIASDGSRVLNDEIVRSLRIPAEVIDGVTGAEQSEVARLERLYRPDRRPPQVRGRTVILVDDGLATGATMQAAIRSLRRNEPARIVVAVPVAARDTCRALAREADEMICLRTPEPFHSVAQSYADFSQTTDEEVRALLVARREPAAPETRRADPDPRLVDLVRRHARPLSGGPREYDAVIERIGNAHFVMLGEATHGTHEFYRARADITRILIRDHGFDAVAVEADWPDAYRAGTYARGEGNDASATEALAGFRRFPTWMWRNTDVVGFLEWLRGHNAGRSAPARAGFYGLDLYSLRTSMDAVLEYLSRVDPDAARRARERYACFDRIAESASLYGILHGAGGARSCENEVVAQLAEMQRNAVAYGLQGGGADEAFYAEQNARLVRSAEAYYRSLFLREASSWNLRDRHMTGTLEELAAHLARRRDAGGGGRGRKTRARIVVWAHNSHLGDARAIQGGRRGELNMGQLVRERHGADAVLVGFTTDHGTVTAAADWDRPARCRNVRPGLPGSVEALFHAALPGRFLLPLGTGGELGAGLREPLLERAIGAVYRPETERESHYVRTRLPAQFDLVIHCDETHAVEPLEPGLEWASGEAPETFPSAL